MLCGFISLKFIGPQPESASLTLRLMGLRFYQITTFYSETGARYKAAVKEFTANANASGQIVINFANVTDNAKIAGIEIIKIISNIAPTIAAAASASPNPVAASTTALSVLGADDSSESNLTYAWATTGTPPAPVIFSVNGTNGLKPRPPLLLRQAATCFG